MDWRIEIFPFEATWNTECFKQKGNAMPIDAETKLKAVTVGTTCDYPIWFVSFALGNSLGRLAVRVRMGMKKMMRMKHF